MTNKQLQKSFAVFYDDQKNKYFRIDKKTGKIQPSFKTGKIPAKFKPNITGTNSILRKRKSESITLQELMRSQKIQNEAKTIQRQNYQGRKKISKKLQVNINQVISENNEDNPNSRKLYKNSSLPQLSQRLNSDGQNQTSIIKKAYPENKCSMQLPSHLINAKKNSKSSYFDSFSKLNRSTNQDTQSQSHLRIAKYQDRLKRHAQLQESKLHQYFSVNNQKLQKYSQRNSEQFNSVQDNQSGFFPTLLDQSSNSSLVLSSIRNPRETMNSNNPNKQFYQNQLKNLAEEEKKCIQLIKKSKNKGIFANNMNNDKSVSKQNSLSRHNNANESYRQLMKNNYNKISEQKKIFLKFHPQYIFKENERIINEQKDRKINFKKLERLYIEQNQRITNRIYRSISKDQSDSSLNKRKYGDRKSTTKLTEYSQTAKFIQQ